MNLPTGVFSRGSVADISPVHRNRAGREWSPHRIERKAELKEARRKQQAEDDRHRHERQVRLEKARVDHLLGQAQALNQAGLIRDYVQRIQALNAQAPDPMTSEELAHWSGWALAQADRIDPVASGAYKTRPTKDSCGPIVPA